MNNEIHEDYFNIKEMKKFFKTHGFYKWPGIRYFLYEYDLNLYEKSKTKRIKLDWEYFTNSDYQTVEHIYPQNPRAKCWTDTFAKYTAKQRTCLRNSLGNLVPLSRSKNSSLQNKCFMDKVANENNTTGFRYGCYSENELTQYNDWTAIHILERGLRLLSFMEKRWNLNIGTTEEKIDFLNLSFVLKAENITISNLNI